jgi:hypothetical protein
MRRNAFLVSYMILIGLWLWLAVGVF